MSKTSAQTPPASRSRQGEQGGIALLFLLAFMVLVIPLSTAAVQLSGQLARNSQVYNNRLGGGDSARAGIELALWHLRNDEVPPEELFLDINGGTTNVTLVEGTTTADLSDFAYADFVLTLDVSGSIDNSEMVSLKQAAHALVDAFNLSDTNGRILMGLTKFANGTASLVPLSTDDGDLHDWIDNVRGNPDVGTGTNIVAAIAGGSLQFAPVTDTFSAPGVGLYTVPEGVTEIIVEVWGGGGGGPTGTAYESGGGGGGYSRSVLSVTPGEQFTVNVGAGGNTGQAGGDSWFGSAGAVMAKGGSSPAPSGNGAQGGQASQGVGQVRFSGGNGGNRASGLFGASYGGGGGGSAYLFGNGGSGGDAFFLGAGSSGAGTGAGGNGGSSSSGSAGNGKPGVAPGGGGGGAGGSGSTTSGAGAAGQVAIRIGGRPQVPDLLVVITDGDDQSGNSDQDIEAASLASGAEVFAVGVGNGVSMGTLEAIATDPDYGDGYADGCDYGETLGHVFYVTDFNALLNLIDCIVQAVNQSALIGTLYDIESVAPDGSAIRVRVLLTPDDQTIILSWQEY